MARARSPDRDKAYYLWLDSKGEILLKDIVNQLGVSDSQIRTTSITKLCKCRELLNFAQAIVDQE
ncbi:MAG: putative binding protein [Firmicutes bacterium]|nr:putative binding protein [Bacillota bacterium]